MEETSRKIATQFKLLELAEKGTERLIRRNKKNEIEKSLQRVEFKYSAHEVLMGEGEMKNLEVWLSVIWNRKRRVLMMLFVG